jgi:hypothetical protein
MKLKLISVLAAGMLSAAPSFATTITLDFEGASGYGFIDNFYNGGTDIPANNTTTPTSGVNYGVSFGLDAIAYTNDDFANFSNAPTPGTVLAAVGPDAALNFAGGFTGPLSFYYSSNAVTQVQVFSGLNGTGNLLLPAFELKINAQDGCDDTNFCHWDLISLNIDGIGQSIQFGSAIYTAGFDNITINSVPEPGTLPLLLSGIGGVLLMRRRKAA